MDEVERAGRAAALGRFADMFETAARTQRSPVEAPEQLTNAYVALIVGGGWAELDDTGRAAACVVKARAVLDPVRDDVHGWLFDRFVATIERDEVAIARCAVQLAAMSHVYRYKVDRLREVTPFLGDPTGVDAIGAFEQGRARKPKQRADNWRETVAAQAAADVVARAAIAVDPDAYLATEILDGLMPCGTRTHRAQVFVDATRTAPYARAIAWAERLARLWRGQTDSFGTNSHYCMHVVWLADILVRGTVGA